MIKRKPNSHQSRPDLPSISSSKAADKFSFFIGALAGRVPDFRRAASKGGKTVGMGLIGCGGMGRVIPRLVQRRDRRIVTRAVFDPDQRSLAAGLREVNPRARVYDDYRELVKAPDVDWVMIASWNVDHCAQTVAAFEAGKHVFCQKPLATTLEDCLAMKAAWKKSGCKFVIGFTLRFSPHYRKIRRLIDRGVIGDIISLEFNETLDFNHGGFIMGDWRRLTRHAGTHLLEKCCHDIDLLNWLIGSPARRVSSFGGLDFFIPENSRHIERIGLNRKGRPAYRTWGGLIDKNPFTSDKDIVDNQVVIIEYENNVRATFHTNCNAAIPERRMYILGTEGAIRSNLLTGTIETRRVGFHTRVRKMRARVRGGHGGGNAVLGRELGQYMLNDKEPTPGLLDALKASVVCFAIDQAMNTGKVVEVGPMWRQAGL